MAYHMMYDTRLPMALEFISLITFRVPHHSAHANEMGLFARKL